MKLNDYIKKYGDNDVDETALFELIKDNDINVFKEIAVLKEKNNKRRCELNSIYESIRNINNRIDDLQSSNSGFDSVDERVKNQVEFFYSRMMKIHRENYLFIIGIFVIFQVLYMIINIVF